MSDARHCLPGREFTLHEQSRLAHFTRILHIMAMGEKYEAMLKVNLVSNPFNLNEVEKSLLDRVVEKELEAFFRRHIPAPTRKGKLIMPKWAKNVSNSVDESWLQFDEGLITWHEFLNEWIFRFAKRFEGFLKHWDTSAPLNLFA